jgi:hypothetical protein
MATPAVGGAIALWLQAKPTLTPEEAMDVIAHTSSHYDESLSYPNNEYGYGQIDVYRGLLYILGIDGIEGLSQHQPKAVSILPIGQGQLQLRFEGGEGLSTPSFSIRIFNTSGQLVSTQSLTGGQEEYTIDLSSLPRGVYAVQVNTGQPATTGSTLVRL